MSQLYHSKGTVSDVRYVPLGSGKKCEVKIETEGRVSGWLEMTSSGSVNSSGSDDIAIGDQVIAHYYDEHMDEGYIAHFLAGEKNPLPASAGKGKIVKNFGGIEVVLEGGKMTIKGLSVLDLDAGNIKIDADGNITIGSGELTDKHGNLSDFDTTDGAKRQK
jgi:phage baseplate assembly protein gpV